MLRITATILTFLTMGFLITFIAPLVWQSLEALSSFQLFDQGYWDYRTSEFHGLAMFLGSAAVATIALFIAAPLGLGAAIFTSEFVSGKPRATLKVAIELLAGIPSVIYGLIGVAILLPTLSPILQKLGATTSQSLLSAGILLSLMVLPTIITFADDALRCVPRSMRLEGFGLGLTEAQVISAIVLPEAKKGLISALLLALGRALGETIAIFLVIGRTDQNLLLSTLHPDALIRAGQTITTKLSSSEIAIAYGDQTHWSALMLLGLCLWCGIAILVYAAERFQGEGERL